MSLEQRDWDEYLAWTRNAAPWQYEETEERAWVRLVSAGLARRIAPTGFAHPESIPIGEGESLETSRPEGGEGDGWIGWPERGL